MRTTARIVADVDPDIKGKLKELADNHQQSMAEVLAGLIIERHVLIFGKTEK